MARRTSDRLALRITDAIAALQIPQAIKDQIEWDVFPALVNRGGPVLAFMVAISLPVPGSVDDDHILYMAPLDDPNARQADVNTLIAGLYEKTQEEVDAMRIQLARASNGHPKTSPGGLALP